MTIRIFGALLIVTACGVIGYCITLGHKQKLKILTQFLDSLEFMSLELAYRRLPLPELLNQTATYIGGTVGKFYRTLSFEIEKQISPNITICAEAALAKFNNLPEPVISGISELCRSLGQFSLDGQLTMLDGVKTECKQKISSIISNQDIHLRSYQTIALCAGAAIAILLI